MTKHFPIHLCQPDARKSCAACCGIYNFIRNDYTSVCTRLHRNTVALARASGQQLKQLIQQHSTSYRALDNGPGKCCKTIFNCEFTGFLDSSCRRVGCLLHPHPRGGYDWRRASFYGAQLCENHFCLSYYYLTTTEQELVINSVDNWYLYGLVITDIDLVKGLYAALSDHLGESLNPAVATQVPFKSDLERFFRWKLTWPFRSRNPYRFGKYLCFGEGYEEAQIPYSRWDRMGSPYHRLLSAFSSEFHSRDELVRAENLLRNALARLAQSYEKLRR